MPHTESPYANPSSLHPHGLPRQALRVLRLLFELGQADEPAHVGGLAARLGLTPGDVAEHLLCLELGGFVHAERARLSMSGLVLATRLPAVARDLPSPGSTPPGAPRLRARAPRQLPAGFLAVPHGD